jgi:Branched-chain amino acid transport protein (AzlD)
MTAWLTVAVLCVGTLLIKAAGPIAMGGQRPTGRLGDVIALVAPALLAALVVYETLSAGSHSLKVDARVLGLAAAAASIYLKLPITVVVIAAAGTTALARALG